MKTLRQLFVFVCICLMMTPMLAQDLSLGLIVGDLTDHPIQPLAKPGYLQTTIDPSFGTTIRRISDAGSGGVIKPMYSTIQAWNADESLMILYNQGIGEHILLNGMTYEFIRELDDFTPADLEFIFWDFDDPDKLYYLSNNNEFVEYTVSTMNKSVLLDLEAATANCNGGFTLGNDVQMMSWDSDVFAFRCNNDETYFYKISSDELVNFDLLNNEVDYTAPMPGPSGDYFYHQTNIYDANGDYLFALDEFETQHSCMGQMANGNDAYFSVTFDTGPTTACIGNLVAHDITDGSCYEIISGDFGYEYSMSGTHISALAHKNTEGGWLAMSMIGKDWQSDDILFQELAIVKADGANSKVCRIAHHRSDEEEFDYWGEPHVVISPRGTRVLYGSDWSGADDGQSIDSYVVELPAFQNTQQGVFVSAKILLEGAYEIAGEMSANLGNLIPFDQPYDSAPYDYFGSENLNAIPNNMVDWVLVEARSGTPVVAGNRQTVTEETVAGILLSNGDVVATDGVSPLSFSNLTIGQSYYFCIRHRNHLDVLTRDSYQASGSIELNLTQNVNSAFGEEQLKPSDDGFTLLHAGDFNLDGVIQVTDFDKWQIDPAQISVYDVIDANLDGVVQNTDYDQWNLNKAKIGVAEIQY